MTVVLLIVGAAVGAPLRYLTDRATQARLGTGFPWGTFAVNVTACLLLGFVTGAASGGHVSTGVQLLLGTGLCGALSTYSTFSFETLRLAEDRSGLLALANVLVSVLGGIGAAYLGTGIAQGIWG